MPETATFIPESAAQWTRNDPRHAVMTLVGDSRVFGKGRLLEEKRSIAGNGRREVRATLREHLDLVTERKRDWARELGPQEKFLSYDPVLARVNFELAQTDAERALWRHNEIKNIKTSFRERHHAEKSELTLAIDANNRIRENAKSHEIWFNSLDRGRVHRAELGSLEQVREQAEVDGFEESEAYLTNPKTQVGALDVVGSLPGKEGGPYPDNYIDIRRKAINADGKAYIEYTRYMSPLTPEQTAAVLQKIDPTYWDGFAESGMPQDAWQLRKPIHISAGKYASIQECFDDLFATDVNAMEEEKFEREIWKPSQPAALYLLDVLSWEKFDPLAIAKAQNTFLLTPDKKELRDKGLQMSALLASDATRLDTQSYAMMGVISNRYGREKPKVIMAGCGSSSGTDLTSNSVSQHDPNRLKEAGQCGVCGKSAGDNHYHCPKPLGCGKEYADEAHKVAEDMTKQCSCGFKFECGSTETVDKASLDLAA